MDNNFLFDFPFTALLIGINALASYHYFNIPETQKKTLRLYPYHFSRGSNKSSILTSMFIHSSWSHFAVNMVSVFIFGKAIEFYLGPLSYLSMYFISGIVASYALVYKYNNMIHYSALGASGATSGIVYGFIMLNPMQDLQFIFIPIPFKAYMFGIIYLLYSYYQSKNGRDNIAHEAHIGGAITGIIFVLLFNSGLF